MLKDIVEVRPLDRYRLYLRFDDGVAGEVDLKALVSFEGVFAPLNDCSVFGQVRLNRELGTIEWPNGADLDPALLYAVVTGSQIPEL